MTFTRLMVLLTAINLFLLVSLCHAQDASADFSHKFELAATDIGLPVMGNWVIDSLGGHQIWWASQASYGVMCLMYRAGEGAFDGNQHALCELEGDLTCDLLSCGFELLFPERK